MPCPLGKRAAVADATRCLAEHRSQPTGAEDRAAVLAVLEIARRAQHLEPQLERIAFQRRRHLVHETLRGERAKVCSGARHQPRASPNSTSTNSAR